MNKRRKPYNKMNLAELRKATRQFDREIDWEQTRPMTPAQSKEFKACQRATLARMGKGSKPEQKKEHS
jgi:hypothetical protein